MCLLLVLILFVFRIFSLWIFFLFKINGYNIHFKYRFEYCCIFFIDCYKSVYVRLNLKYNNTILIKHYKMKRLTVKWIIFYFFGYYVILFFDIFGTTCKKCQKEWKNIFWPTCRVIVFNIPSTISAFIPKKI